MSEYLTVLAIALLPAGGNLAGGLGLLLGLSQVVANMPAVFAFLSAYIG